jgi:hypothetical protein
MADEEVPKSDNDGSEEQSTETRNDVVVKIGLVGDAQVLCTQLILGNRLVLTPFISN